MKKWTQSLKDEILSSDDKVLFDEAAGCLLNGHYRASYILSWIALIESLKRKIYLFANLGDKRAECSIEKIDEAEKNKNSTDKIIFEEANVCQIIDNSEFSKISFFWEQRCVYAHPYSKSPDIEDVKYILKSIIELALGKELLFNKPYLEEVATNIAEKPFYIDNDIEKVKEFAKKIVNRTPEDLLPFFFKTLLFKIGQLFKLDEKFYEIRKLRYFIIEIFSTTSKNLTDSEWSLEDRATKFPYECFIGIVHKETWRKLPKRIKEILFLYYINEEEPTKSNNLKQILSQLVEAEILEEEFKIPHKEKLDKLPFDAAISFYGNINDCINRVLNDISSGQYQIQNPIIEFIKKEKGIELVNSMEPEVQFSLGQKLSFAARNNHFSSRNYIAGVLSGTKEISEHVIAGLAFDSIISIGLVSNYFSNVESLKKYFKYRNKVSVSNRAMLEDKINKYFENEKSDEFEKMIYDQESVENAFKKLEEEINEIVVEDKEHFEQIRENIINYIA